MRAIRWLAIGAAVLTFAIIVLGAVVRITGSGLSCPDWPTCYGHWVPLPSEIAQVPDIAYSYGQVMLEWVHRLLAGVVLGPVVLALLAATFINRRKRPVIARAGGVLALLLVIQGVLGGITVLDKNSAWSLALHLGNALLVLTTILFIVERAVPSPAVGHRPGLARGAVVSWGVALLAMVSAAVMAGSGAALACTTWPFCNGGIIPPNLAEFGVRIHFTHRVLAGLAGIAIILLFAASRRAPERLRRLATAACVLVILQIGLGAAIIELYDPAYVAATHQAVGVLTFATITLLMWRCVPLGARSEEPRAYGERDGLALRGA